MFGARTQCGKKLNLSYPEIGQRSAGLSPYRYMLDLLLLIQNMIRPRVTGVLLSFKTFQMGAHCENPPFYH